MSFDFRAHVEKGLDQALAFMIKDLNALPESAVLNSPGGSARAAIDYCYEVAFVNNYFAGTLRGETQTWEDTGGWVTCPDEYRSVAKLVPFLEESVATLKASLGEDLMRNIPREDGTPRTAYEIAVFMATHMMYHDGQLNLLQGLNGDLEMHWM